jgi:hypothetical protein
MNTLFSFLSGMKFPLICSSLGLVLVTGACSDDMTAPTSQAPGVPPASAARGAGISKAALIGEDFSNYASTSDLMRRITTSIGGTGTSQVLYSDGYNAKLAEIDKNVRYNGHPTLKYNQPGGTTESPGLWARLPKPLSKAWIRAVIRFSPNFTTYGTTPNSAKAYKLLGWSWSGADGRGTLEFTNTNEYSFYWNVSKNGSNISSVPSKNGPHVTTEWTDGRWYQYIIYHEQVSPTTVRLRWWMAPDGATPVLRADITGDMRSGTVPEVSRVLLGLNFNSQRPASSSQALWYGQWEVVDGSQHKNPFNVPGA